MVVVGAEVVVEVGKDLSWQEGQGGSSWQRQGGSSWQMVVVVFPLPRGLDRRVLGQLMEQREESCFAVVVEGAFAWGGVCPFCRCYFEGPLVDIVVGREGMEGFVVDKGKNFVVDKGEDFVVRHLGEEEDPTFAFVSDDVASDGVVVGGLEVLVKSLCKLFSPYLCG